MVGRKFPAVSIGAVSAVAVLVLVSSNFLVTGEEFCFTKVEWKVIALPPADAHFMNYCTSLCQIVTNCRLHEQEFDFDG